MARPDLSLKLYFQPHLAALARAVGYEGKTDAEMRPIVTRLVADHGDQKVSAALAELTVTDPNTHRTMLRPAVRLQCFQLLGPAPEHPRHDEIRYAPPLHSEEDRRRWREEWEKKQSEQQEETQHEPEKKHGRPRSRGR